MSCILHIETSTSACSVAVSEDGQNVFNKEDLNGPSHATLPSRLAVWSYGFWMQRPDGV